MVLTPKPIDVSEWSPQDHHQTVTHVQVAATPVPEKFDDKGGQLLHWNVALVFPQNGRRTSHKSLSFDTIKHGDDPIVQIKIESRNYMASHHAVGGFTIAIEPDSDYKTTDEIFGLLRFYQFNNYSYDGSGSGCRSWCLGVIRILVQGGVLDRSCIDRLNQGTEKLKNNVQYWVPDENGAYFF